MIANNQGESFDPMQEETPGYDEFREQNNSIG